MQSRGFNVLATRMSEAVYEELAEEFPEGRYTAGPGIFTISCSPVEKNDKGKDRRGSAPELPISGWPKRRP